MGENFFNMSLGRFIFLAFSPALPSPAQLHGASLQPPELVELCWKWGCLADSQAQILPPAHRPASPYTPLPCWIMLALPSSRPHPQRGRKCPLTSPGPLPSQPLATCLMAHGVRKSQTLGFGGGQNAEPSPSVGTSIAWLSFLTASAGWGACKPGPSQPLPCHCEWWQCHFSLGACVPGLDPPSLTWNMD